MARTNSLDTLAATLIIRGRVFSKADLQQIRGLVAQHYSRGRTQISVAICEALNWRQANGWLKDRACRDVLLELERRSLIKLPPRITNTGGWVGIPKTAREITIDDSNFHDFQLSTLHIVSVKGTPAEADWNSLVARYHYLGFKVSVGRTLKYLVYSDARIVAAFAFSEGAWAVADRDALLRSAGFNDIRSQLIANSRFLLFPWVKTVNLASYLLARVTKHVERDWLRYYSVRPQLIETFVDTTRYTGTSYRAANWLHIGDTKGYSKRGSSHSNGKPSKAIYLYPLTAAIRRRLCQALGR